MNKNERKKNKENRIESRRKGTAILVRKNLVSQCNINEIKLNKDGEIQAIELTVKGKKLQL
jgi:hypothetical protein